MTSAAPDHLSVHFGCFQLIALIDEFYLAAGLGPATRAADQRVDEVAVVTQVVFRSGDLGTIPVMVTARFYVAARRICACALLLLGTALSCSARADQSRGVYLGVALHRATFELDGDLAVAGFDGRDTALKLLGGYRLTERLAVEVSYFDIGDGNDVSAADVTALTASAAGIWPVGRLDLYGRAGLGYWRTAIRHTDQPAFRDSLPDPFLGVGVSYELGQIALRSDFDLLFLRAVDSLGSPPKGGGWVETLSIGAVWRFR